MWKKKNLLFHYVESDFSHCQDGPAGSLQVQEYCPVLYRDDSEDVFDTRCCWPCPIWAARLLAILTRHLESHTGFLRRRCWTSSPGSSSSCPPPCRTTTSCGATLWRTMVTWFRTTTSARPRTRWPSPRRTAKPGGCHLTGSGSASARGESFHPVSDTSGQVDTDAALNVKSREMIIFLWRWV